MASKRLSSTELANLIAMLGEDGFSPITRTFDGPGRNSGATQAQLLARIRQDLDADLFGGVAYGPRKATVDDGVLEELQRELKKTKAKAAGRGATASRLAAEQAKAGGGILDKGKGFMKGGLGKGLLAGAGTIGGLFVVAEFMKSLMDGQDEAGLKMARQNAPQEFAMNLQNSMQGTAGQRLDISSKMRRIAEMGDRTGMPMSRELQDILSTDPNEVYKFRQASRPASLKEAYARAGLSA